MASRRGDLTVSPFYLQAKNEIVQPGHFVACSRYFVERWMPLLAGPALSLVLHLRKLGYYNPHTGELRDAIRIGMKQLAKAIGYSDRTIQREIETNPWLRYFVRVEASYEQLADGRVRHHENLYRIAMDDPLHPDDEPRLAEIIARRERDGFTADLDSADQRTRRRTMDGARRTADDESTGVNAPLTSSRRDLLLAPAAHENVLNEPTSKADPYGMTSKTTVPTPVNDILSPPPADRGRQSVTRVASKCRLKDSEDIQTLDIPSDIHNNKAGLEARGAGRGDGQDVVVAFDSMDSMASILDSLLQHGVSRVAARKLVAQFPEAEIRKQIEALPMREAKDPAAVLVKSIREQWAPPPTLAAKGAQRAQREEGRETERQLAAAAAREQTLRTEMLERIQAYWRGLPPAEQARIDAEARETLRRANPFVAQLMERTGEGKIVRATLDSLREEILRARLGIGEG